VRRPLTDVAGATRRDFLSSMAAVAVPAGRGAVIDFDRSYLHCAPRGAGIWVRTAIECRADLLDLESGASEAYLLSVKAQTGLGRDAASGSPTPGYEYWMVFSRTAVLMKRVHTSAYFDDPTRVPLAQFGAAEWRLETRAARPLATARDVRDALRAWRPIVARTEFRSADRSRAFRVEYPVKWADHHLERDEFRVETGPVLWLDPDLNRVGSAPEAGDFRWMHLDYRSFDRVRCLIERPTPILEGAVYRPRVSASSRAFTPDEARRVEERVAAADMPRPPDEMRRLFATDRYSEARELSAATNLFAL